MTEKEQKLVTTLELILIERFTAFSRSLLGRLPKERAAIARAFVAKAVSNMQTTRALLDRLACDKNLKLLGMDNTRPWREALEDYMASKGHIEQ